MTAANRETHVGSITKSGPSPLPCPDPAAHGPQVVLDLIKEPTVGVTQELISRVLALCSYVGDHGGGDRARCTTGAERCPSCAANAVATELAEVAGMTYEH